MSTSEYYLKKKKQYDAQKKALLSLLKIKTGCEICGYNTHPQALTFDHKNPDNKLFNIANYGEHSWTDILNETLKCRVICANCHNEHTSNQADNGVLPTPVTEKTQTLINKILQCDLLLTNSIPAWVSFVPTLKTEQNSTTPPCV